jgi:hypothetical protein
MASFIDMIAVLVAVIAAVPIKLNKGGTEQVNKRRWVCGRPKGVFCGPSDECRQPWNVSPAADVWVHRRVWWA